MPLNIGIAAGPPRKKSGLPPKVGEKDKPHMAVMIAAIPKKGGGPPQEGDDEGPPPLPRAAGRKLAPPAARRPAPPPPEPDEMDEPDEMNEPDEGLPAPRSGPGVGAGTGGAEHPILPEAVSYRSEQETCANCVHMQDDGECERLHIPVSHGDGCNLFTDSSGEDADETAEQYEPEEEGEEENEPAYR